MATPKRRKPIGDTPGQILISQVLPKLEAIAAAQKAQPEQMTVSVPVGSEVTVRMPGIASGPMTEERMAKGFLMLMDTPDREFHAALRLAVSRGLDLVGFNKRVHGVTYHELNSRRKHGTRRKA